MPNWVKRARDKGVSEDEIKLRRNRERNKNYDKTKKYAPRPWREEDIKKLFTSQLTDNELARELKRPVRGIQTKRYRTRMGITHPSYLELKLEDSNL